MDPLVSILTPSFNMARFLPETIESVLGQSYPRIEYRVLDAASTDGTADILRRYGDRLSWRSAPDGGAAAALREGFAAARGAIFGWVNADDVLLPHAVEQAAAAFAAHPDAAAVYGRAFWMAEDGALLGEYPTGEDAAGWLEYECGICQPACFFRADAYRAAGGIAPAWRSAFDYDLWIRLARQGPFVFVPQDWARSRMHAANKTLGNREEAFREGMAVLETHFGYIPPTWFHTRHLYRTTGRDQFFDKSPATPASWLAALPAGLARNGAARGRYLWDWLTLPFRAGRLRRRSRRSPAR